MPRGYAFGRGDEATHPDSIRATLAEFVSTFIFVFAGEGSILALDEMYKDSTLGASSLMFIALAHALALFAAIAASLNVSGGHVNPAVTFGALVGGRISLIRAIYYWIAQLLGAIVACLLLRLTTDGTGWRRNRTQEKSRTVIIVVITSLLTDCFDQDLRQVLNLVFFFLELYLQETCKSSVASGVGTLNGLAMEIVLTFGLMYTVYATAVDPKRGTLSTIAPLAIAFMVGANILVGGPFSGASMNPARSFGPALVGWRWKNHWIYWLGPFVGAAIAGIIYEFGVIQADAQPHHHTHNQPLGPEDY
ncbi:hypothetical protein Leryth_012688 [Lithospermum erythrorhizon]|nr:hypothetical protein Leryth_012688 [Lithospermum erythrorhizon]